MSRNSIDLDRYGDDTDSDAIDWSAVETGPVIVHPMRLKYPELPGNNFGDDVWSLRQMDVTRGTVQNLHWTKSYRKGLVLPELLITPFKRVVWLLINRPTPAAYLAGTNGRRWPAASSVYQRFAAFRRFGHFLGQHAIVDIRDVDLDLLDVYATTVLNNASRTSHAGKAQELGYVAAIAHLADLLPAADRMPSPTWSGQQFGGRRPGAGNAREIIHPDTFAPLLWWAQQIIKCALDIIAAADWQSAAVKRRARGLSLARLDAIDRLVEHYGGVLPQGEITGHIAVRYLIDTHGGGIHHDDFGKWRNKHRTDFVVDPLLPQPIPVPVTSVIDGRPWLPFIDYRHIDKLQRILRAAAAVLICACTGMRGEECIKLGRGALRTVRRPDGAHSYRIDGRIFKAVRDDNDQQDRAGKQWVWATIKPGADAIAALEHLADVTGCDGLIAQRDSHGQVEVTTATVTRWISELIEFANELRATLDLQCAHHIATDPAGPVSLERFRRSVAWHIVNQPEGLLAAGVQFGHMQSITTDGYASTVNSGMAATMDQERTRALYTTLEVHAAAAKTGMKVSGPAAKQLGRALNQFSAKQFPGTYADLSKKDERRLRADPDLVVRQNPGHGCLCLANPLKPETMACSRDSDGEPNRNDCKTYCGNRAYTDATIEADHAEAVALRAKIENANPILAARIGKRIEHLEAHIAEHQAKALPLLEIMNTVDAASEQAEKGGERDRHR